MVSFMAFNNIPKLTVTFRPYATSLEYLPFLSVGKINFGDVFPSGAKGFAGPRIGKLHRVVLTRENNLELDIQELLTPQLACA
jgi:hypothetical protein